MSLLWACVYYTMVPYSIVIYSVGIRLFIDADFSHPVKWKLGIRRWGDGGSQIYLYRVSIYSYKLPQCVTSTKVKSTRVKNTRVTSTREKKYHCDKYQGEKYHCDKYQIDQAECEHCWCL